MEFLQLSTIRDSLNLILKHLVPIENEKVAIEKAGGRIIYRDYFALEDIPSFNRSTMDGYAVRSNEVRGATNNNPSLLHFKGRVNINEKPDFECGEGEAFYVPTGGMIPRGADAVVMVEKAQQVEDKWVEIYAPVSWGENIIFGGDDYRKNDLILSKGTYLRPQEVGLLAYLGIKEVEVYGKVKIAIFGSGDEIVPIDENPQPPCIRDLNSYMLNALFEGEGFVAALEGILPDEELVIKEKLTQSLGLYDMVIISGGTSKGLRDLMSKVLTEIGRPGIISHGLTVKPGKPTLLGVVGNKPIVVLPGHPASCYVTARFVALPIIRYLAGYRSEPVLKTVRAILKRKLPSKLGFGEYFRVSLKQQEKELLAYPILGESGLISTLVKSDGLVYVAENLESLEENEEVEVLLL